MTNSRYDFMDEIDKVRSNLYTLMQQLRLYADVASHEIAGDHVLNIDAQTFSIVMDHLALELENTISQIDNLNPDKCS